MTKVRILLIASIVSAFAVGLSRENKREKIVQKIQAANYCEQSSDCAVTGSYCIGCWNYINKTESSSIAKLIETPMGNCDCGFLTIYDQRPLCKNKKCVKPSREEFIASFTCEEFADFIRNDLKRSTRCDERLPNMRCQAANMLGVPSEFSCGIALSSSPESRIFDDYYSKCAVKKIKCQFGQRAVCSKNQCGITP